MILIVDDKQENIFALKSVLQVNGFEVDSALSGEEALIKVLKNTYALIILDVQMPGMDGFEVAEAISGYKKTSHTPIIFLSAVNTHKNFIAKGYTSGAIGYITKPVDPDILILKVKTFFRLYEQTNELNEAKLRLQSEVEVRKQAEQALNKTVKELHSILEAIPQIAFTAKADGTIEYVNEHWFLYASSKESFPVVTDSNNTLETIWTAAVAAQKELETEVLIKNQMTGELRYHLLRAIPVTTDGKVAKWVGTFTDINQQKQLNELLEQKVDERTKRLVEANKDLEDSNHDLQQFASVASHDLKEPLRKIQVFSNIIKEKFLNNEDKQLSTYMEKIILSSSRMSKLINDLLDYSKLSQADRFENTDINIVIREILSDLEMIIEDKKAVVEVGALPVMDAMPGLIRQLFQNLISNALKFQKPGERPVIKISCDMIEKPKAGYKKTNRFCVFKITDNGIGFDDKYSEKIFTIFQRLNSREMFEGTGIGLAIAKKIVDKHNGTITAESQENEGATFIITLPAKQDSVEN